VHFPFHLVAVRSIFSKVACRVISMVFKHDKVSRSLFDLKFSILKCLNVLVILFRFNGHILCIFDVSIMLYFSFSKFGKNFLFNEVQ
jgi:hypothetical protein